MAGSKKTSVTKTILKTLFLPGISESAAQLSFLKPTFMRMVASILEGAGLIRRNHPALYYGAKDVEKSTFQGIISEAIATVKLNGGRNYYQLGLLAAIFWMIIIVLFAAGAAIFTATSFFVKTASAQQFTNYFLNSSELFTHPALDKATDIASIPNTGHSGEGAFNYYLYTNTNSAHQDWGITIIDKMFREGIQNKGGVLQNAFGSLMEVFNNAVLLIAGGMILWMMISIVIDTAKTGKVGGGRHNLVWAPIRIMVALLMIMPLSNKGFSVGQMVVLKFAEWGSNLGTNAWTAFVTRASESNMLASTEVDNFNSLVDSYSKMWMCQITYNASLKKAELLSDKKSVINYSELKGVAKKEAGGAKTVVYEFANKRGDSCGTISFPTRILEASSSANDTPNDTGISQAIKNYLNEVGTAFVTPIVNNRDNPEFEKGPFNQAVIKFACSMSGMVMGEKALTESSTESESTTDTLTKGSATKECSTAGWSDGTCGEDLEDGQLPDYSCYKDILTIYNDAVLDGIESANAKLDEAIKNKSELVVAAKTQGWPSMGWWYYDLYKLDFIVMEAGKSQIKISPAGGVGKEAVNKKIKDVFSYYNKWWEKVIKEEELNIADEMNAVRGGSVKLKGGASDNISDIVGSLLINPIKEVWDKIDIQFKVTWTPFPIPIPNIDDKFLSNLGKMIFQTTKGIGNVAIAVFMMPIGAMFGGIMEAAQSDMYPLTKLAVIGKCMMNGGAEVLAIKTGVYLMGALVGIGSAIPILGGLFITGYNLVVAIVEGPVGDFMQLVAVAMIGAAAIPLYYVPLMPFIKVAFAVLTWMLSIFQMVVILPIAALSNINTQGDGIVTSKESLVVGLSLLFRPTLIVIGFVGSILVLNTFVIYWSYGFSKAIDATGSMMDVGGPIGGAAKAVALTAMYCVGIYTAANAAFSLMDSLPAAFFKYMGGSGFDVKAVGDNLAAAAGSAGDVGGMITTPTSKKAERKEKGGGDKGKKSEPAKDGGVNDDDKNATGHSIVNTKGDEGGQFGGNSEGHASGVGFNPGRDND